MAVDVKQDGFQTYPSNFCYLADVFKCLAVTSNISNITEDLDWMHFSKPSHLSTLTGFNLNIHCVTLLSFISSISIYSTVVAFFSVGC